MEAKRKSKKFKMLACLNEDIDDNHIVYDKDNTIKNIFILPLRVMKEG